MYRYQKGFGPQQKEKSAGETNAAIYTPEQQFYPRMGDFRGNSLSLSLYGEDNTPMRPSYRTPISKVSYPYGAENHAALTGLDRQRALAAALHHPIRWGGISIWEKNTPTLAYPPEWEAEYGPQEHPSAHTPKRWEEMSIWERGTHSPSNQYKFGQAYKKDPVLETLEGRLSPGETILPKRWEEMNIWERGAYSPANRYKFGQRIAPDPVNPPAAIELYTAPIAPVGSEQVTIPAVGTPPAAYPGETRPSYAPPIFFTEGYEVSTRELSPYDSVPIQYTLPETHRLVVAESQKRADAHTPQSETSVAPPQSASAVRTAGPTDEEAARMSSHVYGDAPDVLRGGWQVSTLFDNDKEMKQKFNTPATGFKSQLYERTLEDGQKEYVLAMAGTDTNILEDRKGFFTDVKEDLAQLIGLGSQYDQSVALAKEIAKRYPNITFVGHSLGGGLATVAANATEGRGIVFNPAAVSIWTRRRQKLGSDGDVKVHIRAGDPITWAQKQMFMRARGDKYVIHPSYIKWRYGIPDSNIFLQHGIESFYEPNYGEVLQEKIKGGVDSIKEKYWELEQGAQRVFDPKNYML